MMKRLICAMLTLSLLLTLTPVLAAQGDMTLMAQDPSAGDYYEHAVVDIDSDGDTLYILADDQILTYHTGDEAPEVLLSGLTTSRSMWEKSEEEQKYAIGSIYVQEGVITALDMYKGYLFNVSVGADGTAEYGERIQLEMESRMEEEDTEYLNFQFEDAWLVEGKLLVSGYDFEAGGELQIYAWDASNGAQLDVDELWTQAICEYKDGKILCVTGDQQNMYDRETRTYKPWTLAAYDVTTGDLEEIAQVGDLTYYDVRAMVYDEKTDTLYIGTGNKLYRMVNLANFELAAYHPATDLYSEGKVMAMCGEQVALYDDYGLYLRTADPAQLPTATLSIYGYYGSNAHIQAMQQLGDIPVFFADGYYNSAQELGQALAGGENQLDILSVDMNWIDFTRLMEKGYCYDLSGNETISEYVKDLYPFAQEAVMMDNKVLAVPLDMYMYGWHYYEEGFEKLGLKVPETYAELAELMNEWAADMENESHEEYTLYSEEGSWKNIVMNDVLSVYEQYMLSRGEDIALDNEIFRTVMAAVDGMDTQDAEVHINWEEVGDELPDELNELWMKQGLVFNYYNIAPQMNYGMNVKPLHLKLTEETEYVLPVHMQVMFINPRSENLETAVAYVEALVKVLQSDKEYMTMVSPNHNEPVLNDYYEKAMESYRMQIEKMEEQIETADPIDKPALEEALESYKEAMARYEKEERYSISEEDIAAYRAEMQHAVLQRPSVMYSSNGDDNSFANLIDRYLNGQIKLEQFISEGGSKLRLMQLENQ